MLEVVGLRTRHVGPASFTVPAGGCVALQGPSGGGKSLLLRALADLDPAEGIVRLNGEPRESMRADLWRRRVAMVPAESGWWADQVAAHFPDAVDPAPLLAAVDLPEAAEWEVARLSTGEKQRLALARALALEPAALLLDEPTAALDAAATARVEALLTARQAAGAAILLVTHDAAQAERMADMRLWIEKGRLRPAAGAAA